MIKDNFILLLGFIVAAFIGHTISIYVNPPRDDPFTGTEGRILEHRIELLEYKVKELESDGRKAVKRIHYKTDVDGISTIR